MTAAPLPTLVERRAHLAGHRVAAARAALAECHLCAHHCGVNRLAGEQGVCRAGATARVFSVQVEVADELELTPTFAVALSGCDLRCAFCVTAPQSWNPRAGDPPDLHGLAARAAMALAEGARTIMILGGEPTIHVPTVVEIVAALPDDAKLVWKTNAHASAQARALLDGLFDVWLADYKFGSDTCARRLAGVSDYTRVVRENLLWARGHSELIVRHLLMPGHVDCCWAPVAEWLATHLTGVKVSLRGEFWPNQHSARHPELRRPLSGEESARARQIAGEFNLNLVE
jgi:putative pyruvate formate lyase activating enzyme